MNILILGAGGFICHHLTRAVLTRTEWHVRALDLRTDRLADVAGHPRLGLRTGDVFTYPDWIERQLRWAAADPDRGLLSAPAEANRSRSRR
ncbi:hypothetical protein [Streptomyces sp. WZ-12]|uniref:hypothetical protein n=1 Tax=Streptomyces sp. WZ-12 TaxID=3030210 RepID=UPI00238164D5|nr:hypothetical protein [Streptomyces sp. WZ-12]